MDGCCKETFQHESLSQHERNRSKHFVLLVTTMRLSVLAALLIFALPALAQRSSLDASLPPAASGWRLTEPPQTFIGDELFKMIDGGAALYQEYGFDRAASAHYQDSAGHSIGAEIYVMSDCPSADGIFGIIAAAGVEKISMGDEGALGEYFLVFRKGQHVVTVSGQNSDKPIIDGVKAVGRAIEKKIETGCHDPVVSWQFLPLVTPGSRPVFLRGVIGVGNFYMFAPKNVFGVHEGVTGQRDSTRFFVFRYADPNESKRSLLASVEMLQAEPKYSAFTLDRMGTEQLQRFDFKDRDGNLLSAHVLSRFIIVVIGRSRDLVREMEGDIDKNLTRGSALYHAEQ